MKLLLSAALRRSHDLHQLLEAYTAKYPACVFTFCKRQQKLKLLISKQFPNPNDDVSQGVHQQEAITAADLYVFLEKWREICAYTSGVGWLLGLGDPKIHGQP